MLVGSREIVYRYAGICISCSVDHYELYFYLTSNNQGSIEEHPFVTIK
jgi:hypothetical protein